MKYISLIAVAASALVVGCTVATSERVVERPAPAVSERTVVYTDPAPHDDDGLHSLTSDTRCCRGAYNRAPAMLL